MRLIRHLVRRSKIDGKPFYKHSVHVPADLLREVGWDEKTELEWVRRGRMLVLRRKQSE